MGSTPQADIPGAIYVNRLGSVAAVASNGAGAYATAMGFVAPQAISIQSAWAINISASDVTVGTATSSASYRRMNILNGGPSGTGTTIMASLNATASAASQTSRAFATTANNTCAANALIFVSHLTVGAATADGTDMAARDVWVAYSLL